LEPRRSKDQHLTSVGAILRVTSMFEITAGADVAAVHALRHVGYEALSQVIDPSASRCAEAETPRARTPSDDHPKVGLGCQAPRELRVARPADRLPVNDRPPADRGEVNQLHVHRVEVVGGGVVPPFEQEVLVAEERFRGRPVADARRRP